MATAHAGGGTSAAAGVQVLELKPLKEQLDVLSAKGRMREALAVCEALDGEAQDAGITDRLRVALGVHLCEGVRPLCHARLRCPPAPSVATTARASRMEWRASAHDVSQTCGDVVQGDLDQGLSEIASASRIYPLAMLQYFPSLLPDPKAALATMDKSHMSRRTRSLLGLAPAPDGAAMPWAHQLQRGGGRGDYRSGGGALEGPARGSADALADLAAQAEADAATALAESVVMADSSADASPALVLPYLVTFRSRMLSRVAPAADKQVRDTSRPARTACGRSRHDSQLMCWYACLATEAIRCFCQYRGACHPVQAGTAHSREVVDMALLLGWLQGAEHAALLGMLRQPNAVPLVQGCAALQRAGLYLELVRCCAPRLYVPALWLVGTRSRALPLSRALPAAGAPTSRCVVKGWLVSIMFSIASRQCGLDPGGQRMGGMLLEHACLTVWAYR